MSTGEKSLMDMAYEERVDLAEFLESWSRTNGTRRVCVNGGQSKTLSLTLSAMKS